jgi:hypothetical protein
MNIDFINKVVWSDIIIRAWKPRLSQFPTVPADEFNDVPAWFVKAAFIQLGFTKLDFNALDITDPAWASIDPSHTSNVTPSSNEFVVFVHQPSRYSGYSFDDIGKPLFVID